MREVFEMGMYDSEERINYESEREDEGQEEKLLGTDYVNGILTEVYGYFVGDTLTITRIEQTAKKQDAPTKEENTQKENYERIVREKDERQAELMQIISLQESELIDIETRCERLKELLNEKNKGE